MPECRPLDDSDIDAVCTLPANRAELFYMFPRASYPLTREQMIVQIYKRNNSTVIEEDGKVIAYANIYNLEKGQSCFIGNLVVRETSRGKGIATQLIGYMNRVAISQHWVKAIHISVFETNEAALSLYMGLGFLPYAKEEKTDPDGVKVILVHMKKDTGLRNR